MKPIDEIKKIVRDKPNVASRMIKSRYPDIFKDISKLNGKTIAEKIFVYLHGFPDKCKCCGNDVKFNSLSKGYSVYCSNKCASIDTAEKRKQSIKNTFLKKYGVTSPSQLQSTKNKIKKHRENGKYDNIAENAKKTKLLKYGDENYNNLTQGKKTKLQNYGDENYNNREKFKQTMLNIYGDLVSPNVKQSTKQRSQSGEIGFKSKKFKKWMDTHSIKNVSQLECIKIKKKQNKLASTFEHMIERIKDHVKPLFDINEFNGVLYYDNKYKFECNRCGSHFEDHLYSSNIPRCEKCYPKKDYSSVGEYEVLYYIKSILPNEEIIHKDKSIIGKELDIVIPSRNIAIEFDGIIWHSEKFGNKNSKYHIEKTNLCKEKGIKLIHILDIDWKYKQDIIKTRLKHNIQENTETTIYARNCEIMEIDKNKKADFLNKYHIQGNDKSQVRIGLFHENELVSVMTFGNLRIGLGHKNSNKTHYELYRFCSKYRVIGAAGKLFSHFINKYNPAKVITYSDLRWGYTNFYEKIGFTFDSITNPNYWYFPLNKYNKSLYHRTSFQKHKLPDVLDKFDPELTEWQNMQLNGYDRIWDCGNLKFIWENSALTKKRL